MNRCEPASTDPLKHSGPFRLVRISHYESGCVADERCISCGAMVRRAVKAELHSSGKAFRRTQATPAVAVVPKT